ncbi:F-box/RNI/FBD-like domain protein [Medicago truncatula]|uniref:F-box/RNI/FBD-like domain protein n=1 Tax=Medicago truncatula TaxID=3880 RepID=G7I5T9_MEDTR|nr:F-box/RNI/FBD-like domain protein [Medicago truncatula]
MIDEEPDRISCLPGDVIDRILLRLPIRDVVRTSVLCNKWRYKWTTIPNLVFDKQCVSATSHRPLVIERKLLAIIDHVLLLYSGPINKFKRSIKKLVIEISKGQPYKIPWCLFSCQSLLHLSLSYGLLKPPSTIVGFKNLKSLELDHFTMSQDAFENLLFGCPLLEKLIFDEFEGFTKININAPNLKSLGISGKFEDISFINTFKLTCVAVDLSLYLNSESSSNLLDFFTQLHHVYELYVSGYFSKYLAAGVVPLKLPTPCINLMSLWLSINFNELKEISTALSVFRSSPNLKELKIFAGKLSESSCLIMIDEEPDRISVLPGDVIDRILSCLPIRDVVRTSILSNKWRYKWITIPNLVFDSQCVSATSEHPAAIKRKLLAIIDHVLLLYYGPINKFKLSPFGLISATALDRWIFHLTRRSIKELVLGLSIGQSYKIPWCLFSCQSLHYLTLFSCLLKPPSMIEGLKNLKSLYLVKVTISQDAFESLISSCPLLEKLMLAEFDGFTQINIHAPNLNGLGIVGKFEDISFENTYLLNYVIVDLSLCLNSESNHSRLQGSSSNLLNFFAHIHHIYKLDIRGYFFKYLAAGVVPVKLPTPCINLTYLWLSINFYDLKEISTALCVFRSSPNLKELNIFVSTHLVWLDWLFFGC